MKPVIAVTGMKREASVIGASGVEAIAGGNSPHRLATVLAALAPEAAGIVSFGMAGALDPALRPGDWVIAERLYGSFECECDPRWIAALAGNLTGARVGGAYCDGAMVSDPWDKAELRAEIGADFVDMESHVAAEAAARAGIPFAIARCISDSAQDAMPPAIKVAMRPDGGLALGAVLGSLVSRPDQLGELIRSTRRFSAAFAALKRGTRALGPRLAFDLR